MRNQLLELLHRKCLGTDGVELNIDLLLEERHVVRISQFIHLYENCTKFRVFLLCS
jgi:hypothetical protein